MMIWDAVVWLIVAKVAVMLWEDAAYAARGKQSPRLRERARRRTEAADGTDSGQSSSTSAGDGKQAAPATGWGRAGAAVGGYLADLIEDGRARAQQSRRRKRARAAGAQAVDGVLVEVDDDGCWYADCDTCGWSSRAYRIEDNARTAGAKHAAETHRQARTDQGQKPAERPGWTPTVIRGGRAESDDPGQDADRPASRPEGAGGPVSSVVHTDQHPYCLTPCGPTCVAGGFGWRCARCGQYREGFASLSDAEADAAGHPCTTPTGGDRPAAGPDQPGDQAGTPEQAAEARRQVTTIRAETFAAVGRCRYPMPARAGGLCGEPVEEDPADGGRPDNPYCLYHTRITGPARPAEQQAPTGSGVTGPAEQTPAGSGVTGTAGTGPTPTVVLEASGPEQIRAAFAAAVEAAGEQSEEIAGVAGVLGEAADRYQGLEVAGSTLGHLREAAEAYTAAAASLTTAGEQLQAALADFNTRDGAVGDTVAEAGGNLAGDPVLVG